VPKRIGLFGGTFDPPHVGHLVTAVNVRYALGLDSVVLMVANSPWQKDGTRPISPAEDRLAMVEAAVADVEGLVAGDAEIRRGGPSFTADTLEGLAKCFPGAELFTIVGDDAAAGLTTWQRYDEIVALSRLVGRNRQEALARQVTPHVADVLRRVDAAFFAARGRGAHMRPGERRPARIKVGESCHQHA